MYSFFSNLYLERNIFIIFLLYKGLSLTKIMIGQMVINISMTVSEIPTGLISDSIGKKKGLLIGGTMIIVYYLLLFYSNNFILYLLAACCLGVGSTFVSGTDEAYLYELFDNESEISSLDYLGKFNAIITISGLIATVFGGYIQKINWNVLIYLCLVFQLIGLMFLFKVKSNKEVIRNNPFSTFKKYVIDLKKDGFMKGFLLYIGFQFGIVSAIILLTQDILMNFEVQTETIALFFLINGVINAFVYSKIDKIASLIEKKKLVVLSFLFSLIAFCIILIPNVWVVMVGVVLLDIFTSVPTAILFDTYNAHLSDSTRATGISFYNMVSALIMAVIFATTSVFNELYLFVVCIGGILVTVISIIFISRTRT